MVFTFAMVRDEFTQITRGIAMFLFHVVYSKVCNKKWLSRQGDHQK